MVSDGAFYSMQLFAKLQDKNFNYGTKVIQKYYMVSYAKLHDPYDINVHIHVHVNSPPSRKGLEGEVL